jgi:uncharacterized protein YuzB (UPF0349 family)
VYTLRTASWGWTYHGTINFGVTIVKYGLIFIEVCDANTANTDELNRMEQEYPGVSVLETACMSECALCEAFPYVFFNGEILQAPNVPALMILVRNRIETCLQSYETEI